MINTIILWKLFFIAMKSSMELSRRSKTRKFLLLRKWFDINNVGTNI